MRNLLLTLTIATGLLAAGCCGPLGVGPGCGTYCDSCNDCEGGFGPRSIPYGPLDGLRQMRRSIVCGGGCGEVYYGEWRSTPPDACDPCCDDQFVGGATKCRPFCWQPGALLPRLYGRRFLPTCANSAECRLGCGGGCDGGCDAGCDGGYDGGYDDSGSLLLDSEADTIQGDVMQHSFPAAAAPSGCGCAKCSQPGSGYKTMAAAQRVPATRSTRTAQRFDSRSETSTRLR